MKKFVDSLETIQSIFAVLLFIALVIVVFLQVISRYIFLSPLMWSEELARFLLFWVALMGASMSVKTERHFRIEFFKPEKVQNKTLKRIFQIIPNLCIVLFGLLMIIVGFKYCLMGRLRVGPTSNIKMLYIYLAIPISGITMLIYSLYHIVNIVKTWKSDY